MEPTQVDSIQLEPQPLQHNVTYVPQSSYEDIFSSMSTLDKRVGTLLKMLKIHWMDISLQVLEKGEHLSLLRDMASKLWQRC